MRLVANGAVIRVKEVFIVCLVVWLTGCSSLKISFVRSMMKDMSVAPANYSQYLDKVVVVKDLPYYSMHPNNLFDLYLPKNIQVDKKIPVAIWVHGGAYVAGNKHDVRYFATMMASEGYGVIAMNYQLVPEGKYPTPIVQLEDMYKYLTEVKKQYPMLDIGQLFLIGDSAGAQIVAQFAALQTNELLANDMQRQQVVPKGKLKGVILFCGPFFPNKIANTNSKVINNLFDAIGSAYIGVDDWENSEIVKQTDISKYMTSNYPPTYVTDGNYFSFTDQGKLLVQLLRHHQVEVKSRFFDDTSKQVGHEYQMIFSSPEAWLAYEDTITFLKAHTKE